MLKDVFVMNSHPRFAKEIVPKRDRTTYGSKGDFEAAVKALDLVKFAKLVRIAGMMLQTKVYLFWKA